MNKSLKNTLLLLLAAIIWGSGFVAQSVGAEYVGAFTFLAFRSFLGGLVLIPIVIFNKKKIDKGTIKAGIIIGLWLFMASIFQQAGIKYTTAAKAGFITTMYVIFVPIISFILFRQRIEKKIWLCVFLSIAGLFLLSNASLNLNVGDILVIICAVLYSGHILAIDHFSKYDGVTVSCIQFFTAGTIAFIGMLIFEGLDVPTIEAAAPSILYAGIMSSGIAYTLQVVGQKEVDPTIASICLSMESAFAAIFGFIILHQVLSLSELIGCILMFSAIIISQINLKKK